MDYIDPHVHMISRTTDDYEQMAKTGCVAVTEPAFWAGWDRSSVESFFDYYRHVTEYEPTRAAKYGIDHFCWMCINAKEADNLELARDVVAILPEFLDRPTVLGIGEIGLNKNTANECRIFEMQMQLALDHGQLILVHTPHLDDKHQGTRMTLDMLAGDSRVDPSRVIIDHCEEHTIRLALDGGYWAGLTLYPTTKCTPARAADMIETYGPERILVDSSGDWGPSNPLAVSEFIYEMRRRHHDDALIRRVVYDNPIAMLSQSPHFTPTRIAK